MRKSKQRWQPAVRRELEPLAQQRVDENDENDENDNDVAVVLGDPRPAVVDIEEALPFLGPVESERRARIERQVADVLSAYRLDAHLQDAPRPSARAKELDRVARMANALAAALADLGPLTSRPLRERGANPKRQHDELVHLAAVADNLRRGYAGQESRGKARHVAFGLLLKRLATVWSHHYRNPGAAESEALSDRCGFTWAVLDAARVDFDESRLQERVAEFPL